MSGYTKGPWEATTTEATMNDRNEWRIGPPGKPQVVRGVMSTADAKLIATAPRLAVALKLMLALVYQLVPEAVSEADLPELVAVKQAEDALREAGIE